MDIKRITHGLHQFSTIEVELKLDFCSTRKIFINNIREGGPR